MLFFDVLIYFSVCDPVSKYLLHSIYCCCIVYFSIFEHSLVSYGIVFSEAPCNSGFERLYRNEVYFTKTDFPRIKPDSKISLV